MNFLRRVYLLLLGLLLVIAVTLLLLSPQAVGGWVGSISELSPVVRIVTTIVIDLFLFALMYLQVRPDPGSKVNGLVMRGSGSVTEVSVESARERILKAVGDVPDVISAEATVKPVRGRAEIEMQVVVMGDDVRLPNKQKDINRALRQVIDKQLGLQIAGQPRIHIRIHGAEPVKPVISTTTPVIERKIPDALPAVPEPEPQPKPLVSLFGGREASAETTPKVDVERRPLSDTPLAPVEPEPELPVKPRTGLFGGWLSHDDSAEAEVVSVPPRPLTAQEHDDVGTAPTEARVLSEPVASSSSAQLEDRVETVVTTDDSNEKLLKLDLDEELSHADKDDFVDPEPITTESAAAIEPDEGEEGNSKKPDDTAL